MKIDLDFDYEPLGPPDPCFRKAWDPDLACLLVYAHTACGPSLKLEMRCDCPNNQNKAVGEFRPIGRRGDKCKAEIDICTRGSLGSIRDAIRHELWHLITACDSYAMCTDFDGEAWDKLENRICDEVRSYCREKSQQKNCRGDLPIPGRETIVCNLACGSLLDDHQEQEDCISKCKAMLQGGQCERGRWVPPAAPSKPVAPGNPKGPPSSPGSGISFD